MRICIPVIYMQVIFSEIHINTTHIHTTHFHTHALSTQHCRSTIHMETLCNAPLKYVDKNLSFESIVDHWSLHSSTSSKASTFQCIIALRGQNPVKDHHVSKANLSHPSPSESDKVIRLTYGLTCSYLSHSFFLN